MFIYRFDVLERLKERGYNTGRLRKEKLLGENAIQALRDGKIVGIIALDKVCQLLEMQPGSVIKYIPDPDDDSTKTD